MVDLLLAVEALTKPTIEHHAQKDAAGKWVRTQTTQLDPLLTRLEVAGDPSNVDGDSVTSSGLSRVPVNLTATFEFAKIRSDIRSWCRGRGVEPTRPPHTSTVEDLQRWHVAVIGDASFDPTWATGELRKWEHIIRGLLEPAIQFPSIRPCPVCGAAYYGDKINGGGRAINIFYDRDWDPEAKSYRIRNERAVCGACHTTWTGRGAVLELNDEQHEKFDTERNPA
jgi:hypothetical protein